MTLPSPRSLSIPPAAWTGIFLVALLWGGSFLSIRIAVAEVPTFTVVAFRVGGAAVALWLWAAATGLPVPRGRRAWIGLFGMGLLGNVLPFTLITWGQKTIPSGLAAILNASTAVLGTLVAAVLLADERLTPRKAIGVALGFVGVATAIGIENLTRINPTSLAQMALMAAAMSYAVSAVWARVMLKGVPPVTAAAGMLTCSSLVMIPLALTLDGWPKGHYSAQAIGAMAYLALAASALAYIIYYRLLPVVGAANLSLVTLLVAPIAIVLGAVVFGESLRPAAYLGFAVLAAGLVVIDGRALAWVRARR